ncbi:hypothetical protein, partial [Enterococcus casseliflavus]|uniref:hypothetical protein n=1 Tax=Enterococcus casseliflavus TaxID=37734 RepID=UPI003D0C8359
LRDYATKIRDAWSRRELIERARQIMMGAADATKPVVDAMVDGSSKLNELAATVAAGTGVVRLNMALGEMTRDLMRPQPPSMLTGLAPFDER